MKAFRIPLVHHTIAPFNDPVSDTLILNQKLSEVQENYLHNLNIAVVSFCFYVPLNAAYGLYVLDI